MREPVRIRRASRPRRSAQPFGILGLYGALALLYSLVVPLFEAPDEFAHMAYAAHLAQGKGLPVLRLGEEGPWHQEGLQPPLYYAILAGAARSLGLPLEDLPTLYRPHPLASMDPNREAGRNGAFHPPGELGQLTPTRIALRLWRAISILMGALTVWATWQAARAWSFPHADRAALWVALLPGFLFISSSVNNDNLVNAVAAISFWWLGRIWRSGGSLREAVALGALMGVAALSKASGLLLWPAALLTLLLASRRRRSLRAGLGLALLALAIALGLSGGWFYRNVLLYGTFLPLPLLGGDPGALWNVRTWMQRPLSPWWSDPGGTWAFFRRTFWGAFGPMGSLRMPDPVYRGLDLWAALAAFGLALTARRAMRTPSPEGSLAIWMMGYILWTGASLIFWVSAQGRHFYLTLAPLAIGLQQGWAELHRRCPRAVRRALPGQLPLFGMAAIAVLAPLAWILPAYHIPSFTDAEIQRIPHPLRADFADKLRLYGYSLSPGYAVPGGELILTLYFEARGPADGEWNLFVHLVDEGDPGRILAQEDRYPGRGMFHSAQWRPGQRWKEPVRLRIPARLPPATALRLVVGFYDREKWSRGISQRWPIYDSSGNSLGDSLPLPPIPIHLSHP